MALRRRARGWVGRRPRGSLPAPGGCSGRRRWPVGLLRHGSLCARARCAGRRGGTVRHASASPEAGARGGNHPEADGRPLLPDRSGEGPGDGASWERGRPARIGSTAVLPRRSGACRGPHAPQGEGRAEPLPGASPRRAVRLAFELMVTGCARAKRGWPGGRRSISRGTWMIPAHRMKYTERGDHRVPLSARALAVFREVGIGGEGLVFRSPRGGALPDGAFRELLSQFGVPPTRTGSGRRSATGAPKAGTRGSWRRRRWGTRSVTRWRRPTRAPTCMSAGAG